MSEQLLDEIFFDQYNNKHDAIYRMLDLLTARIAALNAVIKSRRTTHEIVNSTLFFNNLEITSKNDDDYPFLSECSNDKVSSVKKSLAYTNPNLPPTEAGRNLELLFQKLEAEEDENKGRCKRNRRKGLTRVEAKKRERRRKLIQDIQRQLEANSSRYIARNASSIYFRKPNIDENEKNINPHEEELPVPIGEQDMNPDLLFTLSCEKIEMPSGKQLLKRLVFQDISRSLFVYMFWFMHCRFFQSNSGDEQQYLLKKLALIFPRHMSIINTISSTSKTKDLLFRSYPFVLSNAIFYGFIFLFPGNHNLFRGSFQLDLHLSVFRILTGINIGIESINDIRKKLYPDDGEEGFDLENLKIKNQEQKDTYLKSHKSCSTSKNVRRPGTGSAMTYSKDNDKELQPSLNLLPRQQQVTFDANMISPLLENCLRGSSESNKYHKRHLVKRTEPVRWCRTGRSETYDIVQADTLPFIDKKFR